MLIHDAADTGVQTLGSFLRLIDLDVTGVDRHPDAFDRIRSGDLQGIVIRHVFDSSVLEQVVSRLERHDPPFLKTWFPDVFRSWFFGRNLDLTYPDLEGYFQEAATFEEHLDDLFPAARAFRDTVGGVLSALDRGRPFVAPPGPRPPQRYMFTTLRAHMEGGFIPPHFDHQKFRWASYEHLRTLVKPRIVSFVLAFSLAERGGALQVYDLREEEVEPSMLDEHGTVVDSVLDRVESVRFRLGPGTMIVLDSGRYLHRLSPIEGKQKRWTACSFMAESLNEDAVYCWG